MNLNSVKSCNRRKLMPKNFILYFFMLVACFQIFVGMIFSSKGGGSTEGVLSINFGILLLYLTIRDLKKGGWKADTKVGGKPL